MMREHHGPSGRVSTKLKAALAALIAVFAISGLTATQASAAQQLKLSFNDSWIGVPALADLGAGAFHAIDPTDGKNLKIDLEGSLAPNGDFSAPASAFDFPTQVIDAGAPLGDINLNILATKPITGNFNQSNGAFTADLSLKLVIDVPGMGNLQCVIDPLNIPLSTTGTYDFGDAETPNALSAAPFATSTGAVLGSWTGVGVDNVSQTNPPPASDDENLCKMVINGLIAEEGVENPSFDGTIWLGGTATVTGEPDKPDQPEVKKPGKVGKITAQPKKAKVKKGQKRVIKVKVKNTGEKVLKTKLKIKAPKVKVQVKKQMQIKVPAGKVKTFKVPVKVKKTKKAKGKAKIVFTAGGKKAAATLTIKK